MGIFRSLKIIKIHFVYDMTYYFYFFYLGSLLIGLAFQNVYSKLDEFYSVVTNESFLFTFFNMYGLYK